MQTDLDTGLAIESNAYRVTIPTRDRTEALAAFRGKTTATVYRGIATPKLRSLSFTLAYAPGQTALKASGKTNLLQIKEIK